MRSLLLAAALAGAACAESGSGATTSPTPQFVGTRWMSVEGGAHAPTIEFSESRANGSTGCNNWFGQVSHAPPSVLTFSAIGTTRRACEPAIMQIESAFVQALRATQSARVVDGVLVLYDATGDELARFNAAN